MKEKLKDGFEEDAIYAKDVYSFKPGTRKYAKNKVNRRSRHEIKQDLKQEVQDED